MIELKERIGTDMSVLYNFTLQDVDSKKLKNLVTDPFQNSYVRVIYSDDSPIQLPDGRRIQNLTIKDRDLGKFTVTFSTNNLTKKSYINTALEMQISNSSGNNLQNLNVQEYRNRIDEVFQILSEKYGITADYSSIKIKKLELNATFFLNDPYELYRKPILLLMRNVPAKKYGRSKNNNAVKYKSWHEADQQTGQDNLETVQVENSAVKLKIYNKKKQLQDQGMDLSECDRDIMRVEYSFMDRRILESAFNGNSPDNMTDENITELFQKYFTRDIESPYRQWKAHNREKLKELVIQHREQEQKWVPGFLRDCRQREAVSGLPTLFDLEDMREIFRELETGKGRNASRKYRKFKDQCIYEQELLGNTVRTREIIDKIKGM